MTGEKPVVTEDGVKELTDVRQFIKSQSYVWFSGMMHNNTCF